MQCIGDIVQFRVVVTRDQGLRVNVVCIGRARAQAQSRDCEDARTATVIDQALVFGQQRVACKPGVEKLETETRGGMSAGAEGKTGV